MPDIGSTSWLFRAFRDLSTERQLGMSIGPIPLSAIWAYSDRYGLGELFILQIQRLDEHYLRVVNDGKHKGNRDTR